MNALRPWPALVVAAVLLVATAVAAVTLFVLGSANSQSGPVGEAGTWDVIVVGSEPEAIAAAVAAAEEGARTLLVSEHQRLGGLFVLGRLNVLDLRTQPVNLQRGLFDRWWTMVGRGHSFDVRRAERSFARLLTEAGVEVTLETGPLLPAMTADTVVGVMVDGVLHRAPHVIDGTADMDLAAAAGAGYSVGFESLGLPERMVDTLVFTIGGVDWQELRRGVIERGRSYASIDDRVAWGHFGGYPAAYRPVEEGLRLRGLNLGLQDDGTVLVNALLIHGIDPFDPVSRAEGRARAEREAASVVEYLSRELPGFASARYLDSAEALYIRESRHLDALCTLTVDDVLDHRVTDQAVAAGGYPLDVQVLTTADTGYVFGAPEIYGVELCVTVPMGVEGLWVVGKAAGYDPIAASSARVVPFGMNVAEAVGVAAARASASRLGPPEFVGDRDRIDALRSRLVARGAYLPPLAERMPAGPVHHRHYRHYRLMLSRGLAVGGYDNDPKLDTPASELSHLYLLANVLSRFFGDQGAARELVATVGLPEGPLTVEAGLELNRLAACALDRCPAYEASAPHGVPGESAARLTRGDSYALAAQLISELGGARTDAAHVESRPR